MEDRPLEEIFDWMSPLPWRMREEDGVIVDAKGELLMSSEQPERLEANARFIVMASRVMAALRTWEIFFDKRELKEIHFNQIYTSQFDHGTDGHLVRSTCAHLVAFIEELAQGRTRL